jgi:flagellar basal body P-ring formation protein FlgA
MTATRAIWTFRRLFRRGALALGLSVATCVLAQPPASAGPVAGTDGAGVGAETLRLFIAQRVQHSKSIAAAIQRVEVKLGALDARVQLAPCGQIDPYAPAGAKLWGRTVIGVRCVSGANWNMLMPITVSIWGNVLVATSSLAAGTPVSAADFQMQEVEWSRETSLPVFNPTDLDGRTLSRALQPGQPVRADMLRATPVLTAGDTVTLRISGTGFAISAQGQALASAGEGQSVRVKTEQGRTLVGVARIGKTVEVAP